MTSHRKNSQSATHRKTEHAAQTERAAAKDQKENWTPAAKGDEVPLTNQASDGSRPMANNRSI